MYVIATYEWIISLMLLVPIAAKFIQLTYRRLGFRLNDFIGGDIIGSTIVIGFAITVIFPFYFFAACMFFLPAIFSILDFSFLIWNEGVNEIRTDLSSGLTSLRICSVVSAYTSFSYFTKPHFDSRLNNGNDSIHYESYLNAAGSAAMAGNFFLNLTILTLWLHFYIQLDSLFVPIITLVLFFIIDDWALLIHFKLKAEKSVTKLHRARLYLSFSAIILFILISAFMSLIWWLILISVITSTFGIISIRFMMKESKHLKLI